MPSGRTGRREPAAETYDETTDVLVVGGGYAGLAAALFLAHQGVATVLVDRHPGSSVQGRARGINQRTMELYRPLGIAESIRRAGRPFDDEAGVVRCEALSAEWTWLLADDTRKPLPELTPAEFVMADQRSVEPILVDSARARGADVRFGTRCVSTRPDDDGVTTVVEDAAGGARRVVRSRFLVAADGFRGRIRETVGIDRAGPGVTQHWVTFLVRADLAGIVRQRAMFWIVVNDELGLASFLTTSVPDEWAMSVSFDPARTPTSSYTAERCRELARSFLGVDRPVEVLDVAAWEEAVGVADRFRAGRVFLVGDTAHVWPPAGAMGANAAVQDAHNLAWKLAGVLGGWAGEGLLDAYEAERRPAALALADITVARQRARFGEEPATEDVDDVLCTLGQRYRSTATVGATHDTVYGRQLPRRAMPGLRAPHLWLDRGGRRISVHDLCHDAFVLLTGSAAVRWDGVGSLVARELSVPLRAYRIGSAAAGADLVDVERVFAARYGAAGATLLRPDGYVAWCSPDAVVDPAAALREALRTVLGRAD
ncbi:FAD-dependent oxidoreductase [Micromonospora sp. WMMA1363]|uniref:FAD-dependent oxidoreductase n=1 Tax=Micromonospora sp. WMMA1363 TaxID=3053985 RepID=UPI00259D131F|nr:FAD-dependent oxidoreductase [Micromonospora sp. WMMA1363]MDM4718190.1 FAD-dependent oxidoreductase [Micromonospora sp. WMMA1363]